MNNEPFEINENSEKRFMHGKLNKLFRIQYFVNEGLNQLNHGRNVLYGLFLLAGYLGYKESGKITGEAILILVGVTILAFVLCLIWGWIQIMRGKKSLDYFVWKDAAPIQKWQTQMQKKQMEYQEIQVEQNKEMISLLKEIKNNPVQ